MNVGQILETHLGWAAQGLGEKIEAMATAGTSAAKIKDKLKEVYCQPDISRRLDKLTAMSRWCHLPENSAGHPYRKPRF